MPFEFSGSRVKHEHVVPTEELPGTLASDAADEISELESAYVQRRKREDARKVAATDSEYWVAVCFSSREDKESFLKAVGARKAFHGDKYINGYALAKLLGVEMG